MNDVPITIKQKAKGGSRKAFRRLTKWEVKNKILYGILFSYDIKLSEFAEMVGVHHRTVNRWVFEGKSPNEENREKIAKILGYPEYILFYDIEE